MAETPFGSEYALVIASLGPIAEIILENEFIERPLRVRAEDALREAKSRMTRLIDGDSVTFRNTLRMEKRPFHAIAEALRDYGVSDGRHLNVEDKLAIYLHFLGTAASQRTCKAFWVRGSKSISESIHEISFAICRYLRGKSISESIHEISFAICRYLRGFIKPRESGDERGWGFDYFNNNPKFSGFFMTLLAR